jgi:predicted ArsR family transcriptional regulator
VQTTRASIVELLRGGGATVEVITSVLELAPATVRRHLDVLLRDGLVDIRSERLPLGRPHFVFTLSDAGLEVLPGHQFHFVYAALEQVLALTPEDTAGLSGKGIAVLVFDRLAEALLSQCQPAITAAGTPRRIEQALDLLIGAGVEFEFSVRDEACIISGPGCPCPRLLTGVAECPHETGMLSALLGVPVERRAGQTATESRSFVVQLDG